MRRRTEVDSSPLPDFPDGPDFRLERRWGRGEIVAGADEAGRGPWAGPVLAAAVVLDRRRVPEGIDDSKRLAPAARERLYDRIVATAAVSVAVASVARIDRMNIRAASLWAMSRAVRGLPLAPGHLLVDGDALPAALPCPATAVVRGDARSLSIAAASIVAKVVRDRLMAGYEAIFAGYGFSAHKGYGTPEHAAALARLGPCPLHRRSFAPVRIRLSGDALDAVASMAVHDEALLAPGAQLAR